MKFKVGKKRRKRGKKAMETNLVKPAKIRRLFELLGIPRHPKRQSHQPFSIAWEDYSDHFLCE